MKKSIRNRLTAKNAKGAKIFVLGALVASGDHSYAQDAKTLLRQAQGAEQTLTYTAKRITTGPEGTEEVWIYRDGRKRRLEWLKPAVRAGDVLVDDGRQVFLFHKSENSVTQFLSRASSTRFDGEWNVSRRANEWVLRRGNRALVLDAATKAVIATQNGAMSTKLTQINYAEPKASKFKFDVPNGAKVTRLNGALYRNIGAVKRVASWVKAPSQLPAGYKLESAVVAPTEAWMRFSNGAKRFSLFQQKAEGGDVAIQKVDGGTFWKRDGARFLVTGAPDGAIDEIASSLK